jgi:hypothetical protein
MHNKLSVEQDDKEENEKKKKIHGNDKIYGKSS